MTKIRFTPGRAIGVLLVLVFLVGGGNLWASYDQNQTTKAQFSAFEKQLHAQQVAEQKAGAAELTALCTDLNTMAQIAPPAGNPAANPSRRYEQAESRAWSGLVSGLRCERKA